MLSQIGSGVIAGARSGSEGTIYFQFFNDVLAEVFQFLSQ